MRELMLVLKAVADKNRMRILKMLEQKEHVRVRAGCSTWHKAAERFKTFEYFKKCRAHSG